MAARYATEESFFLGFEESSRPARLCAAEAARLLASTLGGLGSRLHGWFIIIDSGPAAGEIVDASRRIWYGLEEDGVYVSGRAKDAFSGYFRVGSPTGGGEKPEGASPLLEALYARPALPVGEAIEEAQDATVEKIVDALGELGVGQEANASLALLGPGRSPQLCLDAALIRLYPETAQRFLRLRASAVDSSPYGPLTRALAALLSPQGLGSKGALLSGAERDHLENLRPMLEFLIRSPYRKRCSSQLEIRLRLCAAAALRFYARQMNALSLPAFVILEGVDRFPGSSLDLVLGLFEETLSREGIRILTLGTELPKAWKEEIAPRYLEVPGPSPVAIAQASIHGAQAIRADDLATTIALSAAGDPLRLKLALRLASTGERPSPTASTEELAAAALRSFPCEYSELLLLLRLSEEVLTDECTEDFLNDCGYVAGIRTPIYAALSTLGFVSSEARPRIASAAAARGVLKSLPDGGRAIRSSFIHRLLELRAAGRIIPSVALFRQIETEARDLGEAEAVSTALELDCIAGDAVYGPSEPNGGEEAAPKGQHSPLEPMADFLAAYAASKRDESLEALSSLEESVALFGGENELASGTAALSRAAFEYAEGRALDAANIAKEALMRLHKVSATKEEAKAQRLLGFCALAHGQVQEGADYFANAYEMAQSVPEPLECILAAAAECAADFALGDLSRVLHRAESAATWAADAFRADWESVSAFIRGRACLEIGRYAEASDAFGTVRAIARVYGQAEASRRAEIWTARAAAFAGEGKKAREILLRLDDDAEALWFLAELELWEGKAPKAAALAAEALPLAPRESFMPIDCFDWSSGFSSLESRAVGFLAERNYLHDQIEAFGAFASGLAATGGEGDPSAAFTAANKLANMAREDRLAVLHPAAHLYLFYRYLILERASPSSMDGATALGKAFKALQLRSTRLDEASVKDGFLEANRWNKALLEAARSRKLL
jgi:tetratricopeptide (TPR) repeat protein